MAPHEPVSRIEALCETNDREVLQKVIPDPGLLPPICPWVIGRGKPKRHHYRCPAWWLCHALAQPRGKAGGHDHGVAGLARSVRVRPALYRERYRRFRPASFDGSGFERAWHLARPSTHDAGGDC